jgi:carboxypeptidase C (cathepsin A)
MPILCNNIIITALIVLATTYCASTTHALEAQTKTDSDPGKKQSTPLKPEKSSHSITHHTLDTADGTITYTATAAFLTASDSQENPIGEVFYTAYTLEEEERKQRPLMFVFNGGPGAASAYLHLGALGPKRVVFNDDGTISLPVRLQYNPYSWLNFTDLVFVDPIGTGYSRTIKEKKNSDCQKSDAIEDTTHKKSEKTWGVTEDAETLASFIRLYLTMNDRWLSPIYLSGESYGGFRVARLARVLQADFGVASTGLIMISPALDFGVLWGGDHNLLPWVALLPSYAATAQYHRNGDLNQKYEDDPRSNLNSVENFALSDFLTGLAGAGTDRKAWHMKLGNLTGLDIKTIELWSGRIPPTRFVKALLTDHNRLISLYDGSIASIDPDPTASVLRGGDPYLEMLGAPITAAFNSYVRKELGFKTDTPYLLLNEEVFKSWNWHSGIHGQQGYAKAISHLKQTISLNPGLRVLIMHGVYDLVTPYFGSVIAVEQMRLDSQVRNNIAIKVYGGGHMPYLRKGSRRQMYHDALQFFKGDKEYPNF